VNSVLAVEIPRVGVKHRAGYAVSQKCRSSVAAQETTRPAFPAHAG
jgi:hypothetical protein